MAIMDRVRISACCYVHRNTLRPVFETHSLPTRKQPFPAPLLPPPGKAKVAREAPGPVGLRGQQGPRRFRHLSRSEGARGSGGPFSGHRTAAFQRSCEENFTPEKTTSPTASISRESGPESKTSDGEVGETPKQKSRRPPPCPHSVQAAIGTSQTSFLWVWGRARDKGSEQINSEKRDPWYKRPCRLFLLQVHLGRSAHQ